MTDAAKETCAQCSRELEADDRVAAGDRAFCRSCYRSLRAELEQVAEAQSANINYVNAAIGAVLGGLVIALALTLPLGLETHPRAS